MKKKILLLFILLFHEAQASILKKVHESIENHHPEILQEMNNLKASQFKLMEKEGAFDAKVIGESSQRIDGFYDGDSSELRVEKAFQLFNSKIYLGHRRSEGEFPSYEGDNKTLDRGENAVGIIFSLLRDRAIDSRREQIGSSRQDVAQATLKLQETKTLLRLFATNLLMKIKIEQNKLVVYKDLVEASRKRLKALERKVKKGGLARIYLRENEQYILKRQSYVFKTQNKIFKLIQQLSLFYRDSKGDPLILKVEDLALESLEMITPPELNMNRDFNISVQNSINLKMIKSKLKQIGLKQELGENALMPKLDLKLETSRDNGSGDETLVDTDNKVMLALEIPIERNKGRGMKSAAIAKARGLEMKQKLTQEKIKVNLEKIKNKIETDIRLISNFEQEVEISKNLEQAEMRKFQQGVSDFFVVNLREQNTAEAKISVLDAKLSLFETSQVYNALLSGVSLY